MQNLTVFENPAFGTVRTVEVEGEPWLVGKDVAAALGYANPRKALDDHVDPEDKMQGDGVTIRDSIGREQHPTIINESGLYSLVLSDASCPLATPQSVLPVLCVLFRVWVFPVKPPQNGRITQTTPFPQSTETTQTKTPALPKTGEAGACCGLTKSNVCAILFIEGCRRPNGGSPLSYKK